MIFHERNCFRCTFHRDRADDLGFLMSHCALFDDHIIHEVVVARDCDAFTPRACEHTLTRWNSHTDDQLGTIAWSRCMDCGALVTTLARTTEGQLP